MWFLTKCFWKHIQIYHYFCIRLFILIQASLSDLNVSLNSLCIMARVLCTFTTALCVGVHYFWWDPPTVVTDWESTKPHLCSKLSLFKASWQMLKVQSQLSLLDPSLPYLRPFQWGTVWPYSSSGIKNTTGQILKV